ncbi:shootin-1-like isoform X2 [Saccostrea echinata]|uniref:shootin-1-like isoform X2 n=1 Tax=Saccostrea echinata TaxID=191078 RepID=UPI002A7F472D|nr:shootin-1-like isoform X2 [Saccostrea echinata]
MSDSEKENMSEKMDNGELTELQVRYDTLKSLSSQVLVQYDDLLYKFQENEKAYNSVVHRLKLRESQLKEMKKLIQPAISEYERMKMKYEIEFDCRTQAEVLATKISTQNKELKRQSKMLLELQGPNPPDITQMNLDLDEKEDSIEDFRKEQAEIIQKLEEELVTVKEELSSLREDLAIEKEHSNKWKHKFEEMKESRAEAEIVVEQYKEAMMELEKVSEGAVREYEALQQRYELEQQCRSGAEKFATEIRIQNEAMKKQSMILLTEAASDPKLMMALAEVEQLTQDLETQKQKYEQEIKELKEKAEDIVVEEPDNSAFLEEISRLEDRVKQFEEQYNVLQEKYKALEVKFEEATRPPPPPPPPPPPSLTTKSKGFLSRLKRDGSKKKKKPAAGALQNPAMNDNFSKAMSEMMERINSGKPLTSSGRTVKRRPSEGGTEETGAMKELNNILKKMKRTQSEADLLNMGGGPKGDESTPDIPKEPAFKFSLKKRAPVDSGTPEKEKEKPEFLTANFKLKGGRLKELLNPGEEDNK